jgi:hypothetical protein
MAALEPLEPDPETITSNFLSRGSLAKIFSSG